MPIWTAADAPMNAPGRSTPLFQRFIARKSASANPSPSATLTSVPVSRSDDGVWMSNFVAISLNPRKHARPPVPAMNPPATE